MKIYRIEDLDGNGPYFSHLSSDRLYKKLSSRNESRPSPLREGLTIKPGIDFCGFYSIEKLKQWFRGCLSELRKSGFYLAVYEVDAKEIKFGIEQVVFPKPQEEPEIFTIP